MRIRIIPSALALLPFLVHSQGLVTDWTDHFVCNSNSQAQNLALDGSGHLYTGGSFHGTMDADPGAADVPLVSTGSTDVFVTKCADDGSFIWARRIGATGYASLANIAADASGDCIFSGYFEGTIDADPGAGVTLLTSTSGTRDLFVIKLDAAGNFLWGKKGGGTGLQSASGLAIDGSNNIYLGCRFDTQLDFAPQLLTIFPGEPDGALLKLDPDGNLLWMQRYGSTFSDVIYDVRTDASGNVIACGHFGLSVDFDPGPSTYMLSCGTRTGFVLKLDPDGNLLWAKKLEQPALTESCSFRGLRIGPTGNLHLAGVTMGQVDLDPGPGEQLISGVANGTSFLLKLDPDGNFIHGRRNINVFGETNAICAGPDDQTYFFAQCLFQADLDPTMTGTLEYPHMGSSDLYLQQFDANGEFIGAKYLGGTGFEHKGNIISDSSGKLYLAGGFSDSVDFDLSANGTNFLVSASDNSNPFLQKLRVCSDVAYGDTIAATGCESFTYGATTYLSSDVYTIVADNAAGCDSVYYLDLTLQNPAFQPIDTILCEGSVLEMNGIVYDSTGVYTQWLTSTYGCDSMVWIALSIQTINSNVTLLNDTTLHLLHNGAATYQWINCDNNEPIPGATGLNFSPSANGSYAALITTSGGCTEMSECYIVSELGVPEALPFAFSVYPNPASDILHIVSDASRYAIHSTDGRLIGIFETNDTPQLDVSAYRKGIYFISALDANGSLQGTLSFAKQ